MRDISIEELCVYIKRKYPKDARFELDEAFIKEPLQFIRVKKK